MSDLRIKRLQRLERQLGSLSRYSLYRTRSTAKAASRENAIEKLQAKIKTKNYKNVTRNISPPTTLVNERIECTTTTKVFKIRTGHQVLDEELPTGDLLVTAQLRELFRTLRYSSAGDYGRYRVKLIGPENSESHKEVVGSRSHRSPASLID